VHHQCQGDTEGNCQGKEAKDNYNQDQNHDQEIVNTFQKGLGSSLPSPFSIATDRKTKASLFQSCWLT
jgi:hypothetical protein